MLKRCTDSGSAGYTTDRWKHADTSDRGRIAYSSWCYSDDQEEKSIGKEM
jgi:hypothetical protein